MPTYLILTRDPLGPRVEDGFEWRVRSRVHGVIELVVWTRYYETQGYTAPDSLRVERVEETAGGKP